MDNLIIINSLNKKRGILKSLFFNTFYRQFYIDDSFSYTFELKNLSKVEGRFLEEAREIISKEIEEGFIRTSSMENEEESLFMFSEVKKDILNKKLLALKQCRMRANFLCPSEYLVGKYFAQRFKARNVQVIFILNDVSYLSLIRQGTLLWVKKYRGKELENYDIEIREFLKRDIFDKEIIKKDDLKQIMADTINPVEVEKVFAKWVKSVND